MNRRPRLNAFGRQLLVSRMGAGWSASAAAEALGVSRATAYKWWRRFRREGGAGLLDRSSRPLRSPRRLSEEAEMAILELRRQLKVGPHRLAALTGHPRSTCYQVLRRHRLHRLDWLDRPTGQVVRRYEREVPGELVHIDVKKLGRIPDGGGHRIHGRRARPAQAKAKRVGYDFVHSLVDDHSRLAYVELLADERAGTCVGFLRRAQEFLAGHGIELQAVMTDNASNYRRAREFRQAVAELGAKQLFTPIYSPQVNGKVERFNRTLLEEWAYRRPYDSNAERAGLLSAWLHLYNHHRAHTALGGRAPVERVNNLNGNYS